MPGGWYHVFGRGLERRDIFSENADRKHFLDLLAECSERFRVRIHAYALMDNHYHAIMETPDGNLSQAMQWLHGSYSMWFNVRHQRVGPLFQGRYGAVPVENSRWAYRLSFYVHLNPVQISGLGLDRQGRILEGKGWRVPTREQVLARTEKLVAYPWSSFRAYAGYEAGPDWLVVSCLLAMTGVPEKEWKHRYRAEVQRRLTRGVAEGEESLGRALAIGDPSFLRRVINKAVGQNLEGVTKRRSWHKRVEVRVVREAVEKIKGEPWAKIVQRHGDDGCALFLWGARQWCGLTLRELGREVGGMKPSAVNKLIARFAKRTGRDDTMKIAQQRLREMSNVEP